MRSRIIVQSGMSLLVHWKRNTKIDQYCRDRFIQLVPNLNSFGHFERWLRHEPYKKLAECPKGFHRDEPYMVRDHGSVLKPDQESLKFIDSLYEEYLPNFSSEKFNVGLDEPWELGQGWSKPEVEKRGKHSVYLDHLKGILSLVENRGKSMEFGRMFFSKNRTKPKICKIGFTGDLGV